MVHTRSTIQENLVHLFLRLNGFFVTGFLVHGHGERSLKTQVDALGVRLIHNREPEREIGPCDYLNINSERTELAICEVKGKKQKGFNPGLQDENVLGSILRWSGVIENELIGNAVKGLKEDIGNAGNIGRAPEYLCDDSKLGPIRIRVLLFCPEHNGRPNQGKWFVPGSVIFEYLKMCFNPEVPRAMSNVRYDFSQWGEHYVDIVKYFKEKKVESGEMTMESLYDSLGKE